MGGACSTTRCAYRVLVEKPEGSRRPPGRPRRRWDDSTKIDFREVIRGDRGGHELDWSGREEEHVAGCCQYGNEPPGSVQCGKLLQLRTC